MLDLCLLSKKIDRKKIDKGYLVNSFLDLGVCCFIRDGERKVFIYEREGDRKKGLESFEVVLEGLKYRVYKRKVRNK